MTSYHCSATKIAKDFTDGKPFLVLNLSLVLYALFTLAGILLTAFSEGPSTDGLINGIFVLTLFYCGYRLHALRQERSKDNAAKAAKASTINFAVILFTIIILSIAYYTVYTAVNGLDENSIREYDLTQDDIVRFSAALSIVIINLTFSLMEGLSFLFFSRALTDIKTMLMGSLPDRNACSAAYICAALTAGTGFAVLLFDLTGNKNVLSIISNVLFDIPCIITFAAMAFLCKNTSSAVQMAKGART